MTWQTVWPMDDCVVIGPTPSGVLMRVGIVVLFFERDGETWNIEQVKGTYLQKNGQRRATYKRLDARLGSIPALTGDALQDLQNSLGLEAQERVQAVMQWSYFWALHYQDRLPACKVRLFQHDLWLVPEHTRDHTPVEASHILLMERAEDVLQGARYHDHHGMIRASWFWGEPFPSISRHKTLEIIHWLQADFPRLAQTLPP